MSQFYSTTRLLNWAWRTRRNSPSKYHQMLKRCNRLLVHFNWVSLPNIFRYQIKTLVGCLWMKLSQPVYEPFPGRSCHRFAIKSNITFQSDGHNNFHMRLCMPCVQYKHSSIVSSSEAPAPTVAATLNHPQNKMTKKTILSSLQHQKRPCHSNWNAYNPISRFEYCCCCCYC